MVHTDGKNTVANRGEKSPRNPRHSKEAFAVMLELFKTLGFCAGFLGENRTDYFINRLAGFSVSDDEVIELLSGFNAEYAEGKAQANSSVEIPIVEVDQAAIDAGEAEGEYVGDHTEDISYKVEVMPRLDGPQTYGLDSCG